MHGKVRKLGGPVDNFFEWKAIKGKPKQPYAIAVKSGQPFGIAGIWEGYILTPSHLLYHHLPGQ